jgi:hypothetical protein
MRANQVHAHAPRDRGALARENRRGRLDRRDVLRQLREHPVAAPMALFSGAVTIGNVRAAGVHSHAAIRPRAL